MTDQQPVGDPGGDNHPSMSKSMTKVVMGIWLAWFASLGITWAQARWYVFHPHDLPLGLLFVVIAVLTLIAVTRSLWGIVCGPYRLRWIGAALVSGVPIAFWAFVGLYAQVNWSTRHVPNTFPMRAAKVMGATFMRAELRVRYPRRRETDRLVMFYNDLATPEEELAKMDRHLVRLEELLGGTIAAKVYWVRGPLLGQSYVSFHGLSLGSDFSPEGDQGDRGDRHELAHAALDWFRLPGSDPPYVLHEGWAMAQCGDDRTTLALAAANARRENGAIGVRELLGPDWYHRDVGEVYTIGGAFVDFLIRTRGAGKFRRFYTECHPNAVEAKCQELYDMDLDSLELEFWADVQKSLQNHESDKVTQ